MTGIVTDTDSTQDAFKRLSTSALLGSDGQCEVSKNDLSAILLAYTLELKKTKSQQENFKRTLNESGFLPFNDDTSKKTIKIFQLFCGALIMITVGVAFFFVT
jgi:hypothetical protein